MYKTNNIILKTTTSLIAFILLGFAVYLFFAGHNSPGGGFVGGLVSSAAIVLLYMSYCVGAIEKILPIDFKIFIPISFFISLFFLVACFAIYIIFFNLSCCDISILIFSWFYFISS